MLQKRPRSRADGRRRGERFISVELEQVRLSLDGRPILRGIDWQIRPGQRWALLGANGAGKTVLLKLLAGDIWPAAGSGRRVYVWRAERFAQPYGVKQEIAYLGAERQDRFERYGWNHPVEAVVGAGLHRSEILLEPLTAADRARIARLLARVGLAGMARRRFLTLSYGERRLVLLARALAAAPRLLLLDELFNGLDAANRARAEHCLGRISRSPLPWVLSTHRSEEIPPAATHWCKLQGGRLILQRAPTARARRGSRAAPLARAGAAGGSTVAAAGRLGPLAARPAEALVRLRRATVWRDAVAAVRRLNFELRAGECWVVHGANGSGKSSLIQTLYGDLSVASGGSIVRAGIDRGVPLWLFKRRVGLVAPELQAIHPRHLRVDEVVASGLTASIGPGDAAHRSSARVRRALRLAGASALERRVVRALSYGQMRRVLFARALVHEPDILLLDEPYAGLDAAARTRLRAVVERAVQSGVTVVMAAHHRDEWPAGATHELELARGRALYSGVLRGTPARRP